MKAVAADFKPASQPGWLLWMVTAVCVVAALASTYTVWQHKQKLSQLQSEFKAKQAQRDAQAAPVPQLAIEPKPYERSAREMLAERSAPWPDALAALEAAAQIGVTPKSVEFNATDGAVRVELVVVDPTRLLKYIDSLNAGVDKGSGELRWRLQQTQLEPSTNTTTAVIVGSR
jgi:hypothetical protein